MVVERRLHRHFGTPALFELICEANQKRGEILPHPNLQNKLFQCGFGIVVD
jgi:hypothetical protein